MALSFRALFCLLAISTTSFACSAPYKIVKSVCVFFSPHNANWCDAQRFCRAIGGELLTEGTFLRAIRRKILSPSGRYWIGGTDLAEERRWKWTNGSAITDPLPWGVHNPGDFPHEDCMMFTKNEIHDDSCARSFAFVCQPLDMAPADQQIFELADTYASFDPNRYGTGACTKDFAATSATQCAVRCVMEGGCVSFYFNRDSAECRAVLFTEARLDFGNEGGWEKFAARRRL